MAGIQRFGRRRLRKKRGERILSKKLVAAAAVVVVLLGLNCRRSFISKKKKKSAQNPNLEDQNHKGLTLDPHKNYHQDQTHLQFHPQNSRNVGNNEGKDHPFLPQFDPSYHHFYLQPELYSQLDTQNLGPILENQEHIVKKRSHLPSSSSAECTQHVRQKSSMGNSDGGVGVQFFQQQEEEEQVPVPVPVTTRSALRRAGVGEIVEVQGGHIVRATGRKDRHSKVCTAKGPRDRRVRLSAHTAIQFYDVQDRLGYDRPSKAVDWLIKKAKASIDELDQLPAWSPTSMNMTAAPRRRGKGSGAGKVVELGEQDAGEDVFGDAHHKQQQQQLYGNGDNSGASLLPPSLDSDAIADTIKSFFPMGGGASAASSRPQMLFQDYRHGGDGSGGGGGLLSRSGGSRQSQDLRLSLQSFQVQDPIMMHSHNHQSDEQQQQQQQQHSVFAGAAPVGYENPNVGWAESEHQPSPELGRLQRLVVDWQNQHQNSSMDRQHHHHHHSGSGSGSGGVGLGIGGGAAAGGFMFNQTPLLQPLFGGQHSQFFTQRGPLQSSNTPSVRAWISDPSIATTSEQQQQHLQAISVHPQGLSGLGYPSGGFSGFHIPARIQGDEEHDGDLKPSSASSGSHH